MAEIADHGADCCVLARTWLEGLDATYHRGAARDASPAWVAQRFGAGVGPAREEVHWCEIPGATLDPTAVEALARALTVSRRRAARAPAPRRPPA